VKRAHARKGRLASALCHALRQVHRLRRRRSSAGKAGNAFIRKEPGFRSRHRPRSRRLCSRAMKVLASESFIRTVSSFRAPSVNDLGADLGVFDAPLRVSMPRFGESRPPSTRPEVLLDLKYPQGLPTASAGTGEFRQASPLQKRRLRQGPSQSGPDGEVVRSR